MSWKEADRRIPVTVLTGFLGSGKTTLLRRLLIDPRLCDTAVLINEFGEVGLDHLLVADLTDAPVLLDSGCICCSIRGDFKFALQRLESRRARGELPQFRRVVIETTGLADPTPILATILSDRAIRHRFRIAAVVTTIDAVYAEADLSRHPEVLKQIVAADQLLVTKTDLVGPAVVDRLQETLRRINPAAAVSEARTWGIELAMALDGLQGPASVRYSSFMAQDRSVEPDRASRSGHRRETDGNDHFKQTYHGSAIKSSVLTFEGPVRWTAFGMWLTLLVHRHGARLLRLKGILNVEGSERPVAVHVVQHLIHPPEHLPASANTHRLSQLVIISEGLDLALMRRSYYIFTNALARSVEREDDVD